MNVDKHLKLVLISACCLIIGISFSLSFIAFHAKTYAQGAQGTQTKHLIATNSSQDWPEFHGDVTRDSYQPNNTSLSKANATTLTTVSGPGFTTLGSIESSPAIYQGVVYAAVGTLVLSGTTKIDVSTMYAIDATSGQILWKQVVPACQQYTNQEWIASSPAVTTGMVNGTSTTEIFIGWGAPQSGKGLGCVFDFNEIGRAHV